MLKYITSNPHTILLGILFISILQLSKSSSLRTTRKDSGYPLANPEMPLRIILSDLQQAQCQTLLAGNSGRCMFQFWTPLLMRNYLLPPKLIYRSYFYTEGTRVRDYLRCREPSRIKKQGWRWDHNLFFSKYSRQKRENRQL